MIGNLRQGQPGNINLFGGLGYKGDRWWLEVLAQRQWSQGGGQIQMNLRFNWKIAPRANFYAELYPVSTRKTFTESAVLDCRIWHGLRLGGEMENLHRPGPDSLGGGPRLSYPLLERGKISITPVAAYHVRRGEEANFFRVYLATTIRF